MHRAGTSGLERASAVRAVGPEPVEVVLQPAGESAENLALMRRIDEQYLKTPFYGSRRMAEALGVNRKCVQRLMRLMGLEAIYPKPRLSQRNEEHRIYPYLLRNVAIVRPNQVWSSDITYVPMPQGWMYLTVVMDWYSRYVLSWRLSNTLDGHVLPGGVGGSVGESARRRFSTPTRACSTRPRRSRVAWRRRAWRSAWTAAAGGWTTCSWSGCGGR